MWRVLKENECWFCFMERGIVHHNDGRLIEDGEKMLFEPLIEPIGIS